jgi:hypothetical protein
LKFGVEVRGNGTRWWSAVGGYLRYKRAPHPTKFAHLLDPNAQWLNTALLYQLQMRQTFSLLSQLSILIKYRAIAVLLLSMACLNEQSAADALASLPDAIASLTRRNSLS